MDNRLEKAFHEGRNPHDQYILRGQRYSMGGAGLFKLNMHLNLLVKMQVLARWAWMRFHLIHDEVLLVRGPYI